MLQTALKPALDVLGLKQGEFAKLLNVKDRTVSAWATGSVKLPGPVEGYLRLLQAAPPEVRRHEFERLADWSKQLDEGVYRIEYSGRAKGEMETDTALAVLRKGKILGADRHGSVFMGSYEFDPLSGENPIHLSLEVPPRGMLVNGVTAGDEGARIEISCAISRAAPVSAAMVNVAGELVCVEFTYVGPLPN